MKSIQYSLLAVVGMTFAAYAADWPQWGGTNVRNMVSSEKGMPTKFNPGKKKSGSE